MNKDFMRKYCLVCDWYAENNFLSFEDNLVFEMSIKSIDDLLEYRAGSNRPEKYDNKINALMTIMNNIGRDFDEWPLVRGD